MSGIRDRLVRKGRQWCEKEPDPKSWSDVLGPTVADASYALGHREGSDEGWYEALYEVWSVTEDVSTVVAMYENSSRDMAYELDQIEMHVSDRLASALREYVKENYPDDAEEAASEEVACEHTH